MRRLFPTALCGLALLALPHSLHAASAAVDSALQCVALAQEAIPGVDLALVQRTWLGWINRARKAQGLPPYVRNPQLERTAFLWSQFSRSRGMMSHKRPGQTVYYDYAKISAWFANLGLTFANVHGKTFTENIGYGPYSCSQKNCTQKLIRSLRTTFDFYMGEKTKKSRPHYNSIMGKEFTMIGMGVAIDPVKKQYYVTTHYATAIAAQRDVWCP